MGDIQKGSYCFVMAKDNPLLILLFICSLIVNNIVNNREKIVRDNPSFFNGLSVISVLFNLIIYYLLKSQLKNQLLDRSYFLFLPISISINYRSNYFYYKIFHCI